MKQERQAAILSLIESRDIQTQDDLVIALNAQGYQVTQATVSRDIRELGLSKETNARGIVRYAVVPERKPVKVRDERERFAQMFVSSVLDIQYANNMVVVHTLSGAANAAAEAIDGQRWPEILGTMAGDNTIFAVIRTNEETPLIAQRLQRLLQGE